MTERSFDVIVAGGGANGLAAATTLGRGGRRVLLLERGASGYRSRMLVALVAWPLLTAVPAFVVAIVGAVLDRRRA